MSGANKGKTAVNGGGRKVKGRPELTEDQRAEIREAFDLFDTVTTF
jgi:hypothetical protein